MKCEFCGSMLEPGQEKCQYCGAPCPPNHLSSGDSEEQKTALSKAERYDSNELRPMGSPDISFLKKNQEETENKGISIGCIIAVAIVLFIIIVMASVK